MGPVGPEVALRGQGIRQKLFIAFAISSVIPLLAAVYLGLPFALPHLTDSGLYPRDRIFFWVLLFFLATLELLGLYIALDLVRGVAALAGAVTAASASPATALVAGPVPRMDEVGVLVREFSRLLGTIQEQAAQVQGYVTRIAQLDGELRTANSRLRETSLTDELTDIGNRRQLHHRLAEEVSRSTRFGHPVTLLSIDVEGFEAYVGRHGATEGDAALTRVAALLRSMCREADVPCRMEGPSFALLLLETPKRAGLAVAERIRQGLDGAGPSPAVGAGLTVSVGVAAMPEDAGTADDLLERAGAALRLARDQGGNRVAGVPDAGKKEV